MSKRTKGMVNIGTTYEVQVGGPMDARGLVRTYSDLLNPESWGPNVYNGMLVVVAEDSDEDKCGVYVLKNCKKVHCANAWRKIGSFNSEADIKDLINEALDNPDLKVAGADVADVALTARKVDGVLTAGTKTYDGSEDVEITASDLGAISALVAGYGISISNVNTVSVAVDGILTQMIQDGAVTDAKISSVSTDKLVQGEQELVLSCGDSNGYVS